MAARVLSERYRIVRHLARGGMAEVYLAHDELLDRQVAVKVLFPELAHDANFVERFRREARAAAGLNHHNIVSVYDFGEDDGSYFIVMEYIDGETLRDVIRTEGPMEPSRVVEIGAEVAAALAIAHANGIVHRDVKPGNVLISSTGSVVKVADFGIARAGDPREGLTQTGAVMGTATYLSPEQAQGTDLDARSDVYSLGVVLYEMATGRPPFAGSNPVAVAYQHVNEPPQPPSSRNPALPPAFDALVLEALAKDPADRQASATELRAQLLALSLGPPDLDATMLAAPAASEAGVPPTEMLTPVGAPVAARTEYGAPPIGPAPTPDSIYRRRRLVLLGLLGVLALAAVVIILALSSGSSGTTTVPRVIDLTVDDAKAAVSRSGLTSTVEQQPDRTGDPNRVIDQKPPADAKVKRTTVVTLVVPGTTTTPTEPPSRTVTTPEPTPTTARPSTTAVKPTTTSPTTVAPPTVPPTSGPILTLPPTTAP